MSIAKIENEQRAPALRPAAGVTAEQRFDGQSVTASGENATAGLVAAAKAETQARYIMAREHPRNWLQVRRKLLDACERPGFAKKAKYEKPTGDGKVVGPTIRFAEEVARCIGNIGRRAVCTFDDAEKRIIRVLVEDLENTVFYEDDVVVEKTVERSKKREGQTVGSRLNAQGKPVYIVMATDDELFGKKNSFVSKTERNLILKHLPMDILEEALATVDAVRRNTHAQDPDAAIKATVDAWDKKGVTPADLEAYLGHPLKAMTAEEDLELQNLYAAVTENETTFAEALAAKRGAPAEPKSIDHVEKVPGGPGAASSKLREKVAAAAAASAPAAQAQQQAPAAAKAALPADLLKALEARIASFAGPDADPVSVVDEALGGVGLDSMANVSPTMATDAIAAIDRQLLARKRTK